MDSKPVFAVVGHPNKGKSSIVATLAHNDSVAISSRSGTTVKADEFAVETEHAHYDLVDTPGFQRPRKVLTWLEQHANSADQRAKAVASFVADTECQKLFPDEVELLKPIINGAAILYVVDGSRPYGIEYEVEMEILRWTGQPSMALINPIESEKHVDAWRDALAQYFKTVRIFNPFTATFASQIELLEAFAYLQPKWSSSIKTVVAELNLKRHTQLEISSAILARLLEDLCAHRESQKVLTQEQASLVQPVLQEKFKHWMVKREQQAFKELLANYTHFETRYSVNSFDLPPDLMDIEQWFLWGLNRQQLATTSALAGAAAGAAVDMAVAGHSFFLGAIGGGIAGFSSAWFGSDRLAKATLTHLPLGGHSAVYGPVNNRNFPYVVMGRFIHMHRQISLRNHAKRDALSMEATDFQVRIENLEGSTQKELHKALLELSKQKPVYNLDSLMLGLLKSD